MAEREVIHRAGVAFVLPRYEGVGAACRIGRFAAFTHIAADRFGIGIMILEAGLMLQLGPAYIGICHISRQKAAFDRLERVTPLPPSSDSKGGDNG